LRFPDPVSRSLSSALLASALLCLSACNKAESPDKVQADVAKAQSDAAEANAKADEKQKQVEAEAAKDRADAQVKAHNAGAEGSSPSLSTNQMRMMRAPPEMASRP